MKTNTNPKVHFLTLLLAAALLLLGFLNASWMTGPLPGMSPLWYWGGVVLHMCCGLIAFLGGMSVYRRREISAFSKCALWVSLFYLYLLAIISGDLLQQTVGSSLPVSFAVMCVSRFLVPLLVACLLGVRPTLVFALLPAVVRLGSLPYWPDNAGYIVLSALGSLLPIGLFTAELFRLIGGGRLPLPGMILCALSDAVLVQMVLNSLAVRMVDRIVAIEIIQYLPFLILSALLHLLSKCKAKGATHITHKGD